MTLMTKSVQYVSAVLIVFIGATMAYQAQSVTSKLPIRQYFKSDQTVAVWDWYNPTTRSSKDLSEMSDYFYLHQINAVYVDVSMYADLKKQDDQAAIKKLEDSVSRYVEAMQIRNVKVYAAAGHVEWSKPTQRHIPLGIIDFAHAYNASHANSRLSGVQFDIESYNQTGFTEASNTEKSLVLIELLDTVDEVVEKNLNYTQSSDNKNFEIGFAVPYWFDNQNGNIPSVTWKGKTGPTIYHILDRLNAQPVSNIVVMAYRNGALGSDGTIFHSRTEVEYAEAKTPNVKVVIGQEVNDAEPAKITFFGSSYAELSSETRHIYDELKPHAGYGGIAINDLEGLLMLSEQE